MALRETFKIVIDVATDGAQKSLKQLRKDVIDADGAFAKMKVGTQGLLGYLRDNAAAVALTAGTALVTFGVKSVQAFQDTALAAGQFADATGLAVDDASRWIETADLMGISGGDVEAALGKMNKTLGASPDLFTKLGVEIAKTDTGATDVNGTFLNVVDRLNAIEDPALRARTASQLLGKGWQSMAELIGQGSAGLKASLAGVSDAQVIDPDELAKAREFRSRMDDLNDRLAAVSLTVGEQLVPVLSDAAELMDDVAGPVRSVGDAVGWLVDQAEGLPVIGDSLGDILTLNPVTWAKNILTMFTGPLRLGIDAVGAAWDWAFGDDKADKVEAVTTTVEAGTDAAKAMAAMYAERVVPAMYSTTSAEDAAAESANRLAIKTGQVERAAQQLGAEWDRLKGKIDEKQAWVNLQSAFDDIRAKGEAAMKAAADGAADAEEKMREYQSSVLGVQGDVLGLGKELGLLPDQVEVLIDLAENGQVDELERRLTILTRNRTMNLDIIARGGAGYGGRDGGPRATGGRVSPGGAYVVGDNPDGSLNSTSELFVPDVPGRILSAPQTRRALASGGQRAGDTITVNLYGSEVTAGQVAREIAWQRMVG